MWRTKILTEFSTDCELRVYGNFLQLECNNSYFVCPWSFGEMYAFYAYFSSSQSMKASVTALCSNDPVLYQACIFADSINQAKSQDRNMICGNYLCKTKEDEYEVRAYQSNCNMPSLCSDIKCSIDDSFFSCRLVSFHSLGFGVPKSNVCDGKCHCMYCEDEENCYGLRFSYSYEHLLYHNSTLRNLHVLCYPYDFASAVYAGVSFLKLSNTSRCSPWVRCKNKYDQTNCTDPLPAPILCRIDGRPSNVSTNIICKRVLYSPFDRVVADMSGVCDDGIDTHCADLSPICYIHKHLLCDGQKDCADGADEENSFCGQVTMETCKRRYFKFESRIPLSWIGDGVLDCLEGEDEDREKWPMCSYDSFNVSGSSDCKDVYLCKDNQHKFVQLNNLCDKQFHCDNLNQICSPIYRDGFIHQHLYQSDNLYYLNYCLPGLNQLEVLKQKCDLISYPPAEVWLSQRNRLFVPSGKQSCANMFGESYVFMSCSGLCFGATCPLRPIVGNVCAKQKYSQIYSISKEGSLTLIHKNRDIYQVTNFFECRSKICLSLDKVCNLVDDCGDGSDEESCVNSFTCNRNNRIYGINYIPLSSVCDGQIDCADVSDETDCCSKRIFQNTALTISSLLIGILAVILNSFSFLKLVNSVRKVSITSAFLDKILIIVISCGDWLLGMYLVAIAIIDIFVTKWRCEDHYEWLVSKECAWLGILSTIGSQISLFSMTALSLTRVRKIRRGIQVSRNTNKRFVAKTGLLVLVIIATSVVIAVLPLTPHLEDSFINDLYYPEVRFLRGFISKSSLQRKFELFFGRFRKPISELSWKNVRQLITKMFTNNYGGITVKVHHFYGNDAVCLFKYFVSADDPQALFSWAILSINFFCFTLITMSYAAVGAKSQRSSVKLGNSATSIKARNETLQRKVSVIIATDFLCWVPFIVISLLNTTGIIDATKWYALFSTIILPLNSVINPFLYHNLLDCFVLPLRKLRK